MSASVLWRNILCKVDTLPGALVKTSLEIEPATGETSEPPLKTPLKALA